MICRCCCNMHVYCWMAIWFSNSEICLLTFLCPQNKFWRTLYLFLSQGDGKTQLFININIEFLLDTVSTAVCQLFAAEVADSLKVYFCNLFHMPLLYAAKVVDSLQSLSWLLLVVNHCRGWWGIRLQTYLGHLFDVFAPYIKLLSY